MKDDNRIEDAKSFANSAAAIIDGERHGDASETIARALTSIALSLSAMADADDIRIREQLAVGIPHD